MSSKGTFLYPAIVDRLNQSQTPADVYTKTESDAKYAKLASANTFTTTNTFNDQTNFKSKIELKNSTNQNGVYIDNFDYSNQNYSAIKFFKGSTNALQIEVNNNTNEATLSYPSHSIKINNLANPVNNDNATNKAYVDSRVFFVSKNNITFTRQEINTTAGNQVTKYYSNSIPYAGILTGCTNIISISCADIPVQGEHLVITWFPKRLGNNALIEIYQYGSSTNITNSLNRATFQFVIQKSI